MTLNSWLEELDACDEAVDWSKKYQTLPKAWIECPRGDWLIWLAATMEGKRGWPTKRKIVSVACDCVEMAIKEFPADEVESTKRAIKVVRAWTRGAVDAKEMRAAVYNTENEGCWYPLDWMCDYINHGNATNASFVVEKAVCTIVGQYSRVETIEVYNKAIKRMATVVRRRLKPGPWPGKKGGK